MEAAELELERRSKFLNGLILKKKAEERQEQTDRLNVRVRAADMPCALQSHAFRCSRDHLNSTSGKLDSKRLALTLKKEFDASYGPAWHCIVGTSFGSYVTHSLGGFLYFSIDKIGAEFVGTFILIFGATAAPIVNQKYNGAETLIGNAASAGLAVMIVILSTGHISGAHLNPSLTIAFATLRHFPWVQVPAYIAAQVSGSICASFALKGVFHPFMSGGVTTPSVSTGQAFAIELIITFNLLFVVTAVATDTRAVGELAGIAVGATVMLNILVAGPSTGGSMNPVRTLGPAIAAGNYRDLWVYLVAPTIGALAGAGIYTLVKLKEDGTAPPRPRSFRR